jgi:hypothetical protein
MLPLTRTEDQLPLGTALRGMQPKQKPRHRCRGFAFLVIA